MAKYFPKMGKSHENNYFRGPLPFEVYIYRHEPQADEIN